MKKDGICEYGRGGGEGGGRGKEGREKSDRVGPMDIAERVHLLDGLRDLRSEPRGIALAKVILLQKVEEITARAIVEKLSLAKDEHRRREWQRGRKGREREANKQ